MDTTRPKITFGVVGERSLLGIIPVELDATGDDGIADSLAIELWIWLNCGFGWFRNNLWCPSSLA
jgi:hypothetical protein